MSGTILSYVRDRAGLEVRQGGSELWAAQDKLARPKTNHPRRRGVLSDSSPARIRVLRHILDGLPVAA